MDITQNMQLFTQLVCCGTEMFTWCYDANGKLLNSNCPEEAIFSTAFSVFGVKDKMLAYAKDEKSPIIFGTALGIVWGAAFEQQNGMLYQCHVLGPVYFHDVSVNQIETGFASYNTLELSVAWKKHFLEALYIIPTSPNVMFSRYILMLHYCLTGEHLFASDLAILPASLPETAPEPRRDRHKVWGAEQALLQMVRNGDLNYSHALNNSMLISSGVKMQGKEPLRQAKTSIIVFCSIVCRAAIEGGLSPEEAYSLGDSYIQSCENAKEFDLLNNIAHTMYDDFIHRVNKCRTNPQLSKPVQQCIDYIEMNLSERIRAADLATLVGYSEYYITHKFKKETGFSINDYIKFAKIERAKVLLISGSDSVQQLADTLAFSTRSYFSSCFKDVTGVSPAEYRIQRSR